MIMAHGLTRGLPDGFLGVQVRRGHRQRHDLQPWVCSEDIANGGSLMPPCPVPEQQDRHVGIGGQDVFEMCRRGGGIQRPALLGKHLSGLQVQATIEAGLGASRIGRYDGWLPTRCPCPVRGGLEIQARFIFGQDHCVGRRLPDVNQFFSSCSSKATTSLSRRDLNTFCVRW